MAMPVSGFSKAAGWAFAALLLTATVAIAAEDRSEEVIAAARKIMGEARYCALVTLDESGAPRARAMDAFAPEPDMTVWLGTNRSTRKVGDIERDPRVTLYYFAPSGDGYASIQGRARVVDDPDEKRRRWKPGWEDFYPDRETDYILIEVTPERIEAVDTRSGLQGDAATWRPPAVDLSKSPR